MDVRFKKAELLKSLARASLALGSDKSPIPILSCIFIDAAKDGATVSATDTFVAVSTKVAAEVKSAGRVAVPGRRLLDAVKAAPAEVTLSLTKNGRVALKSGKWKREIPCHSADDFPAIPTPKAGAPWFKMPSSHLASMLDGVAHAVSADETRPHLACVRFDVAGKRIKAVATDGHRLALEETEADNEWRADLVAGRAVDVVKKLSSDLRKEIVTASSSNRPDGGGHICFEWPGMVAAVKRIGEQFPPYEKVIPKNLTTAIVVDRASFVEAVKRAKLADDGVTLKLETGSLLLLAEAAESGDSAEQIDVDYAGTPISIAVDARYFGEALAAIVDDAVTLRMSGPLDPLRIEGAKDPEAHIEILMPRRSA